MYRDEPSSHVQEILNGHFWPDHPLGRPLTGTPDTVESMQRDDFLSYRATHYHAGSTVVSAAGKIRHEEVIEHASRASRKHSVSKAHTLCQGARIIPRKPHVASERRDVQQTQLALGFPGPSHHDPRRYALQILNMILGGNASSRLFQELREKRGLCYSVSAHPSSFNDTGMLNISLGLEQRNVEKSLRLILSTFEDLKKRPVRPAELKRAKEYAVGTSRMSLERTSTQNMRLGRFGAGLREDHRSRGSPFPVACGDLRRSAGGGERFFGSASRDRGSRGTRARRSGHREILQS